MATNRISRRWLLPVLSAIGVVGFIAYAAFVYPWSGNDSTPPTCFNYVDQRVSCEADGPVVTVFVATMLVLAVIAVLLMLWRDRASREEPTETRAPFDQTSSLPT